MSFRKHFHHIKHKINVSKNKQVFLTVMSLVSLWVAWMDARVNTPLMEGGPSFL